MMQERVMKIIASDRVPPSPDLPGPRPATLRSLRCPGTSPQQGKIKLLYLFEVTRQGGSRRQGKRPGKACNGE